MKKRPFSRLIATVLSLVMILTMLPIIPLTAHATAPETYSTITVGERRDIYVSPGETQYFLFMPTVGGTYTFYSSNHDYDPCASLLDAQGEQLAYNDDYNSLNFSITYRLEANTMYFFSARFLNSAASGNITIHLEANELDAEEPTPEEPDAPKDEEASADVWDGSIAGEFGGGSGTEEDPYLIYTAEELAYLAYSVRNGASYSGCYFKLMSDIDLAGIEWTPIGIPAGNEWYLDNSTTGCFRGNFDGDHHTIYNLTQNTTYGSRSGLFGYVYYGSIKNLAIRGANIAVGAEVSHTTVGILVGSTYHAEISGCAVEGSINAEHNANAATMGGLVGSAGYTTIYNCTVNADLYMISYTSGFNVYTGGVVGYARDRITVTNCFFVGTVDSTSVSHEVYSAGIVGATISTSGDSSINNCVAVGAVIGEGSGVNIETIYSNFSGANPYVNYCFYDLETNSNGYDQVYSNLSLEDLKNPEWVAANVGWDFESDWTYKEGYDYPVLAGFGTGEYIPELPDEPDDPEEDRVTDVWDGTVDYNGFGGGSGTEEDPYLIYTAEQLAYLAYLSNDGEHFTDVHFKLMSDIDLAGLEWTPIAKGVVTSGFSTPTTGFAGHFDGNHKIISNLSITNGDISYMGLFGILSGSVCDLGMKEVNINVTVSNRTLSGGAIAGAMTGGTSISRCFVEGATIIASAYNSATGLGSIVGFMAYEGAIVENCYGIGSVIGTGFSAGIAGIQFSYTTINNCYFAGYVTNTANTTNFINAQSGGITNAMYETAVITNCFFVGEVTNNYGYVGAINGDNRCSVSNCYYYTTSSLSLFNGTSTNVENFVSKDWVKDNLGWNLYDVWIMSGEGNPPRLYGFATDESEPDMPDDPEIPDVPDEDREIDVWDGTIDYNGFGGGSGTEEDPYLIYTAEQLAYFAYSVNNGTSYSGCFIKLMSDIDLNGIEWTPIGVGTSSSFDYSGAGTGRFTGNFDGNGHIIYRLTQTSSHMGRGGLFGVVGYATISNLSIKEAYIEYSNSSYSYSTAGILGGTFQSTVIENCSVEGTVSISHTGYNLAATGGLVGIADTVTISNCAVRATLTTYASDRVFTGGLFGISRHTAMSNIAVMADISSTGSTSYISGIVGTNDVDSSSSLDNSFFFGTLTASGNVNSDAIYVPYGASYITVTNCYYNANCDSTYATSTDPVVFSDAEWVEYALTWDMDNVWTMGEDSYPELRAFIGGYTPEQPDDPENPDDPEIPDDPDDPEEDREIDVWDGNIADGFGGGSGTEEDPYLIYTAEQLAYLAYMANNSSYYSGYFKLMADIDLAGIEWSPIGIGGTAAFNVSNAGSAVFCGSFDGNGHTIYNLTQTSAYNGRNGLFGILKGATVKDLAIRGANINVAYSYETYLMSGILAGMSYDSAVSGCSVDGSVEVYSDSSLLGIGGFIGHIESGTVTGCDARVSVYANATGGNRAYVGGFAGILHPSEISDCILVGDVTGYASGSNAYVGGFIGISEYSGSSVKNCIYVGEVSSSYHIDGFYIPWNNAGMITLENAYFYSTTASSYATFISLDTLCAEWFAEIFDWDFESVWAINGEDGLPTLRGFAGEYTEPELPDDPENPDDPDDPEDPDAPVSFDVWDGTVAERFGGGSGTESDPYLIYYADQLAYLAVAVNNGNNFSGVYFKLMNNLDLNGIGWTPIGRATNSSDSSTYFGGIFDGNHKIVKNVKLSGYTYYSGGLFGSIDGAVVKNLGVVDVDYTISASGRTGALIGVMKNSTVFNCYATGRIELLSSATSTSGSFGIGALIGDMRTNTTLYNSFASCTLECNANNAFVGGLVGFACSEGTKSIYNCYANSEIINNTSTPYAGGIVGALYFGELKIEYCFSMTTINGLHSSAILGARMSDRSPTYSFYRTYYPADGYDAFYTSGAVSADNFKSQSWLESEFAWDFEEVWKFTNNSEFPVLCGFGDANYVPDDPDDPERPGEIDAWDGTIDYDGFGGGHGTVEDPYLIYTAEQLAYLAYIVNAGENYSGVHFKLMNDLDLMGIEWTPIGKGETIVHNWTLDVSYTFSGNFDGNGHIIYDLTVKEVNTSFAGLFGVLSGATVSNLAFENATVEQNQTGGGRIKVGVLAGAARSSSISRCSVINSIVSAVATSNPAAAGGLIGLSEGCTITDSYVIGMISGNGHVGGIIGGVYTSSNTVTNCYSIVDLSQLSQSGGGNKSCGGIIGYAEKNNTVYNCVALVQANNASQLGSIIGRPQNDTISNCYYLVVGTLNTTQGTLIEAEDFQSLGWLYESLGWDFESVWEFKNDALYPTLRGFESITCEHSYVVSETVEATCQNGGYTRYVCEHCGSSYTADETPALPHTPGEWIIISEAGCTTAGEKYTQCTVCGEMLENIYVAPHGHNYVSYVTREVTCTTPGIITTECTHCGDYSTTYIYSEHHYTMEHIAPTCEEDGRNVYTCDSCGHSYEETIPGGHHYEGIVTKVATETEEGEMTYTCTICQDSYTEVIPMRAAANVLLVQDSLPWDENANAELLNAMAAMGSIDGWDITTTSNLGSMDLSLYNVIYIANDQSSMTYERLRALNDTLTSFASAGGVVIYGACDQGWGGGNISYELPGGVTKYNYYSYRNYIVNGTHNVITGALTDGKTITNELLYSTYSSHSYFANLPDGATVILSDANGNATLVEYPLGDGYIILSGLTWEYTYDRNFIDGTSFAKEIYDDLILHAASLSSSCDHAFDMGVEVAPTCSEKGYILHTCELCGAEMKDNFTDMIDHTEGEWETVLEATTEADGRRELHCTECGELLAAEIIPMINAPRLSIAGDTYLQIGGEYEFILSVTSNVGITSIELAPIFNSDIFELVSAEWLIYDTEDKWIDMETLTGTANWSDAYPTSVMMRIVLKVKAPATQGQSIGAQISLTTTDGYTPSTVLPLDISIAPCDHTNGAFEVIDGEYHAFICVCGQTMVEAHGFDHDCDAFCDACGHEREVSHTYSDEFFSNDDGHWHECTICGAATELMPHSFGSDKDGDCDECGHVRFVRGDFDGDGDVDSNDAIYLLYYSMYGAESYPIYQPADLDGNEEINSDDAVYLVYHTFFGEVEYPINN